LGASFDNKSGLHLSSRNEWRQQTTLGKVTEFVSLNQFEYQLDADFRLLGKFRIAEHEGSVGSGYGDGMGNFTEANLGLAYRPVDNDRFNLLARLTRLKYQPTILGANELSLPSVNDVLSGDWSSQLNPHLEWVGKLALRRREQQVPGFGSLDTTTTLTLQRVNVLMPRDLRLGAEYRVLSVNELDTTRRGWLGEIAWQKLRNIRIGIGYDFTDFSDELVNINDYEESGWFLRIQGIY
jgi:hypothetical protein